MTRKKAKAKRKAREVAHDGQVIIPIFAGTQKMVVHYMGNPGEILYSSVLSDFLPKRRRAGK